jgi:hypothetical protein
MSEVDNKATEQLEVSQEQEFNVEDFFNQLDREVNGSIFDGPEFTDNKETKGEESDEGESSSTDHEKELENLKKRYEDSSEEAKRLYRELAELKKYEDYIPIMEKLRSDPDLVEHIAQSSGQTKRNLSIKESLGLGEDFVFDPDDAVGDPNSQSAKVLETIISKYANDAVSRANRQSEAENSKKESINSFRQKYKLSDDQFNDLLEWSKKRSLTMEDIYFLKNRESREREIANKAITDREAQLKKMKGAPRSLASVAGESSGQDPERSVINAVLKAGGAANIFE